MSASFAFDGKTAVVTGAASGIGAALAANLADRGCRLALADIDMDGLEQVAQQLALPEDRIALTRLDVADRAAVKTFADNTARRFGGADLLFNNAGVGVGGHFDQVSEADFDWLISINFLGVVDMTRAVLPLLKASEDACIVNISSLFGLIAPAGQTAYAASKFAVRGFSDALRHELAGSTIGVTTVHPGGINTRIAANARAPADASPADIEKAQRMSKRFLVMPPERAAAAIIEAVARRKPRVLVGADARRASLIERLFPARYWSIIGRQA